MIGILRAFKAVLCGFVGIRARGAAEDDNASLRPLHIVIVGVVSVACFVLLLLAIVGAVVDGAGGA